MIFSNENAKIGGDRMTSDFMKELLSKDEKITVEYKNCQYGIQEDVYEDRKSTRLNSSHSH